MYAVLSDKDQRAIYDEQGIVDEESDSLDQDRNWEEYWRTMFPKVGLQVKHFSPSASYKWIHSVPSESLHIRLAQFSHSAALN